jgi:thiol-disulfide isomerase/thioredoxin
VYRRGFLTAGGSGVSTAIGGCLNNGDTGSAKGTTRDIELEAIEVGASPGGTIAITPPDRVVLLDFFATWCAPCKPEMANLRAARSQFSRKDVFMVSITQEGDETAIKQFWNEYSGTWPVVIDADLIASKTYSVTGIPTIIILTPDGTEVFRHTGLAGKSKIVSNIKKALQQSNVS